MFLTGFTPLSVILLFPLSITFFVFMHVFDAISNIDEVLSTYPSANVFVFGDFNVHHREDIFNVHGRISLNSVLLLLLVNFVSGFRLKLRYISLIVSIRSGLIHFHGFQRLVQLPLSIEITFFVCTSRIHLNLK